MSSSHEDRAYIAFASIFTAVSGLVSLFLILIILLFPRLRRSSKHLIVLAICTCSLYNASFVSPLTIQGINRGTWIHGCMLLVTVEEISPNITLSTESLLLISLAVDFFVRLLTEKKSATIISAVVMIVVSVVLSIAVLLPIMLSKGFKHYYEDCYLGIDKDLYDSMTTLSFIPQGFLMLVAIVFVSLASYKSSNTKVACPFPLDIVLACALMIGLELPWNIFRLTYEPCPTGEVCASSNVMKRIIISLAFLRPCLISVVWFLCPVIRGEIRKICSCCQKSTENHQGLSMDDFNETYI